MVRGTKKTRKTNTTRRKTQRRRNTVKSGGSTSRSTGLGSFVHKGIRSVLAMLPGSALTTKIADAVFTTVGWSASPKGAKEYSDVSIFGMSTAFYLTPAMFLGDAPVATSTAVSNSNPEKREFITNYVTSRITQFSISARNAGSNTIHGTWAIGFWPFTSSTDEDKMAGAFRGLEVSDIRQAPKYVEGPASKPLLLRHYFSLSNFYARTPGNHSKWCGLIAIAYTDLNRSSYTEFTAADFNPQIDVKGSVVLSSRSPEKPVKAVNSVDSKIQVACMLKCSDGKTHFKNDSAYKCQATSGTSTCKVVGNILLSVDELSLADMEF